MARVRSRPRRPRARPRRRLSAEASRQRILEAAQRRVSEAGPEGLRLQELAADLGLSHPAILHHFGSREGLLAELAAHGARQLNRELAERIRRPVVDVREILELTSETLASRGQARLLAWLVLSGRGPQQAEGSPVLRELAEVAQASRSARRTASGGPPPDFEDTAFSVLLVGLALFGDALVGEVLRQSLGFQGTDAPGRFRAWLARVLEEHLGRSGENGSKTAG
jgi:AcrR family transcriptional regulator